MTINDQIRDKKNYNTTIEDQGEKQIKAIQNQGQVETIKKYAYDSEDTPFISKQKKYLMNL